MTVTKNFNNLDTDNTLGGNSPSDYKVSSQKAIKEYVDNNKIDISDIASSVSASSTNSVPVGAKLFYDTVGDIETALHTINSGGVTMNSLTFNLTGDYTSYLSSLTVNGTTYIYSDFTNNSLTLSFPQGTSITWSATSSGITSPTPSSGSLTLNSDSTVTIEIISISGGGGSN